MKLNSEQKGMARWAGFPPMWQVKYVSSTSVVGQQRKSSVGRGGGRLPVAMAGAFAAAPQFSLPWPRFPSPLIEPDVRISRIRHSGSVGGK